MKQLNKHNKKLAAENTFEAIAREWYIKFSPQWVQSHGLRILRRLEKDIFPWKCCCELTVNCTWYLSWRIKNPMTILRESRVGFRGG